MKENALFLYITIVLVMFVGGKVYTVWDSHLISERQSAFERRTTEFMAKGDRFTGQDGRDMSARIDALEKRIEQCERSD